MTVDDPTLATPASLTSAKPGLRIKAKILDFLLFFVPWLIFVLIFESLAIRFSLPDNVIDIFSSNFVGFLILYLILSEGIWGTSIGKKIYKMRVQGPDGAVPGILRAFVRNWVISVLYGLYKLSDGLSTNFINLWQEIKPGTLGSLLSNLVSVFLFVLCGFILFSTAKQKNGFAGLHDLISGTRVVVKP